METETSPGEFHPFAKLPYPYANFSDFTHALAAGMFILGVVLAYMMWKSGERGIEIFILFPVSMAAGIELMRLALILYMNLNRAEANGTITENWRWVRRAMHAVILVSIAVQVVHHLGFL